MATFGSHFLFYAEGCSAVFCFFAMPSLTKGDRTYTIMVSIAESAQPAGYAATMGIIVLEMKFAIMNI